MSQNPSDVNPFGLDQPATPPSDNEKMLSGLSYVSQIVLPAILPLVLLLSDEGKRSAFVRHHAVQSLALLVVSIIYEMVVGTVVLVIGAVIPCLLAILWVLFLAPLVPLVYYGYKAFQGETVEMPWLTAFLKQNNWL